MLNKKIIGICVDADNILRPTVITPIVRTAKNAGSIGAVVLCGNLDSPALSCWNTPEVKRTLDAVGAVWLPLTRLRPGKNAADIALTYEAAMMTQSGVVNEVWILSSDSDFTPLAERLQEKQIRVVVFGSKNTPQSLRKSCSSFVLLDDIQNGTPTASLNTTTPAHPFASRPDQHGWFHGFVRSIIGRYGFIQINPREELFFCAKTVDAPMLIRDLHNGDQVEFKLGRNYKGWMAVHVRKTLPLQAA